MSDDTPEQPEKPRASVKQLTAMYERLAQANQRRSKDVPLPYVKAAEEAKQDLKATFAAYRKGWEDYWEDPTKGVPEDVKNKVLIPKGVDKAAQREEVLALLKEVEAEQLKMVDDFVVYCQEGGDVSSMLVNVDPQWSFFAVEKDQNLTGSLAVPGSWGDTVKNMAALQGQFSTIITTKDTQLKNGDPTFNATYSGEDVISSEPKKIAFGGKTFDNFLWTKHCVVDSKGTDVPEIILNEQERVREHGKEKGTLTFVQDVRKGGYSGVENYSGIKDQAGYRGVLPHLLKVAQPEQVVFNGLALDFCVQSTINDVLDMRDKGEISQDVQVVLIRDATSAVFDSLGESEVKKMEARGVKIISTQEFKDMKENKERPPRLA